MTDQLKALVEQTPRQEVSSIQNINSIIEIEKRVNKLHGLVDKELTLEEYQEHLTVLRSYQPKTRKELLHVIKVRGKLKREFSKNIKGNEKDGYYATYPPIAPRKITEILFEHCHFKRISNIEAKEIPLFMYRVDTGTYTANTDIIDGCILAIQDDVTERYCKEIRGWIRKDIERTPYRPFCQDEMFVVMKNGLLDLNTHELLPFDPEKIFIAKNAVNYKNVEHPKFPDGWTFDIFLEEQASGDREVVKAFWQLIQYALLTNKTKNVFVYLYSQLGSTGKGTLSQLLINLVGEENAGIANIKQLNENFMIASIYDKVIVIGNENDNVFLAVNENMKNLATGDGIKVEIKGQQPFWAKSSPLIVQSMNTLPSFSKIEDGTKSRMRVFDFKHSYQGVNGNSRGNVSVKKNYIHNTQLLEYIAYKALNMKVEEFRDTADSKRIRGEIEEMSNPVLAFVNETLETYKSTVLPIRFLFQHFRVWLAMENKADKWTQRGFTQELNKVLPRCWTYDRKNKRPFAGFEESDYHSFNIERQNIRGSLVYGATEYLYNPDELKKAQPLIYKENVDI